MKLRGIWITKAKLRGMKLLAMKLLAMKLLAIELSNFSYCEYYSYCSNLAILAFLEIANTIAIIVD